MLLTNKFIGMTIKKESVINTYLMEIIDMKNQLKVFSEEIADKIQSSTNYYKAMK